MFDFHFIHWFVNVFFVVVTITIIQSPNAREGASEGRPGLFIFIVIVMNYWIICSVFKSVYVQ